MVAPEELEIVGPAVFLAGPIQGASDWQEDAFRLLRELAPGLHVSSPRRPGEAKGDFTDVMYDDQVAWEARWLRRCGAQGAILFWLAKEVEHVPGRAYAQTTRFELGEWVARSHLGLARLVVGIEPGFPGARYVSRRLRQSCPQAPLCDTLEETCWEAARLALP